MEFNFCGNIEDLSIENISKLNKEISNPVTLPEKEKFTKHLTIEFENYDEYINFVKNVHYGERKFKIVR